MEHTLAETKKCSKCGRELPLSAFGKNTRNKDGHQYWCKECTNKNQNAVRKNSSSHNNQAVNPKFESFTNREILQELKARGYHWERMYYTQEVKYSNI